MKNAIRIMALLAAAPLAGCMLGPQPTAKSAAPAIATPQGQQTPALQTVASGLPGEVKTADDPGFGGPVSIMILSEYDAASGRRCKRVALTATNTGGQESRVACQGLGGWYWTDASLT